MKIIRVDNFNRDNYPDLEINLGGMNEDAANDIADVINKRLSGETAPFFYRVVEDNYQLNEVDL